MPHLRAIKGNLSKPPYTVVYIFLVLLAALSFFAILCDIWTGDGPGIVESDGSCKHMREVYCADVLNTATQGKWIEGNVTVDKDVTEVRATLGLPATMSREDTRCGIEFSVPGTRLPAHCDPMSDVPCCAENSGWCGVTRDHCELENTFDVRKKVRQTSATWLNTKCKLKAFPWKEACHVLTKEKLTLVFLGDSQARHFFTAFVLLLSDNYREGALKNPSSAPDGCLSSYQIVNNDCRKYLIKSAKERADICDGQIDVEFFEDYQSFLGEETKEKLKSLDGTANSYVIIGAGTHYNSDSTGYLNDFLAPLVQTRKSKWPRYIAETLHEVYSPTANERRRAFNKAVRKFARENTMSVFDNAPISANLESHDGRTFGLSYHMLKVQLLLHHLSNVQSQQCSSSL